MHFRQIVRLLRAVCTAEALHFGRVALAAVVRRCGQFVVGAASAVTGLLRHGCSCYSHEHGDDQCASATFVIAGVQVIHLSDPS